MKRMLAGLVLACTFVAGSARAVVDYTVSLAEPEKHLFRVTLNVQQDVRGLDVQMPAWNALYQIRDFAARVQNLRAEGEDGATLPVRKLDKLTWRIEGRGKLRVQYEVFWDDAGPFSAQLNAEHAFINFAMVLVTLPGRRQEAVRLRLVDVPQGWKVAVALPAGEGPWAWQAKNYDALVDAPLEAGAFEEHRFEANNAKVRVVIHGPAAPRENLLEMLRRVVAYQTTLMREVPFEEFIFIYHFGAGGGGMEHPNSTAISVGGGSPDGVSAHEFFHLWNVKRIRPQSLEPVDYTRENWTRALWFAEGVTSTYGNYTLVRTGLWTTQQFYADLAGEIRTLQNRQARLWKSVEEASLDAWHEKYPLYNRGERSISYYNKGQLVGHLLDILIRDATENRKSLDDVLRELNEQYAHKGKFYGESDAIRAAAEKVAGRSFEEFFARYVAGTAELPYAQVLARAGLVLTVSSGNPAGYEISEDPGATPLARRIREGLLKGTND
jgi:predicted metalloprotease with PDZ domain